MKLLLALAFCVASAEAGSSAMCPSKSVQTASPQCTNSEWQLTPDNEGCVEKLCPR